MDDFIAHAPLLLPLLLALGALSGFLAGLLGVGGGIVLVPGLYFVFSTLGFSPGIIMHMAVGTSLAIIIPTGISSALAHYRRGAVRMDAVRRIGPGIVIGVAAGTMIANSLSGHALTLIFAVALIFLSALMQVKPRERIDGAHGIGPVNGTVGGFVVGALSSLMGIGGATLNVPFLTLNGLTIHQAVASASALGPVIALPGAIGFILIGLDAPALPPMTLGYVHLAAFVIVAPLSVLTAPLGARAAHAVSVKVLRGIFSAFIVIVAIKMFWDAWHGG